ncbi:glutathione peroxidase [Bizionia sp. KMM 8389]
MLSIFQSKKTESQPTTSLYDVKLSALDGSAIDLHKFKGQYILFVNVASHCGFTKQYTELQELYETYQNKLVIIGVPCNQFGNQEPGSAEHIQSFCQKNYGVTFLIAKKTIVKGKEQHPLYQWLTKKSLNGKVNSSVTWNFQKYLINKKGHLVDYYYSITKPLSPKITKHLNS